MDVDMSNPSRPDVMSPLEVEPVSQDVAQEAESSTIDPGSLDDIDQAEPSPSPLPPPPLNLRNDDIPNPADPPVDFVPNFVPRLDDIKIALEFIDLLKDAKLDSDIEQLDPEFLARLRNPPHTPFKLLNRDERLSIELFLADSRGSDDTYTETCQAIKRAFPDCKLLSLYEVKARVAEYTNMVAIWRDMCLNSCLAYTGAFHSRTDCMFCGEARYHVVNGKRSPRQQYHTIPVAPMIQALYRTTKGAEAMEYRTSYTKRLLEELRASGGLWESAFSDFFDGSDHIEALKDGRIDENSICLLLSVDGAQLYRNKTSDCWMWIWVIFELDPNSRYKVKNIIPGGTIPGPNKPKHLDSFLFPSLHHVAALSKEGLKVWKAHHDTITTSRPFIVLASAERACWSPRQNTLSIVLWDRRASQGRPFTLLSRPFQTA
ncbi:hypothetical protein AAF712_016418 [Marasmius tenuissimus]|uniref:Transposase n=1 Tax=Marasmius tenuissimus TaxID=585030 RepID=A0ABR2Z6R6_9AGAR